LGMSGAELGDPAPLHRPPLRPGPPVAALDDRGF